MVVKKSAKAAAIGACFVFAVSFAGAVLPAQAKAPHVASAITAPSAGASVSSPVTVAYSLSEDASAGGTAAPQPSGSSWPATAPQSGPKHLPQAYLVIDSPAPAAGSAIQADADHVAFPLGQYQLSVPLAAGQHQLQVVFVNRKGIVTRHFLPSAPVSISVH